MVGVGPTDKGLPAYDKGNWNKVFLVWDHRIRKENKVNAAVPAPRTAPAREPARFLFPQTTSQEIGFLLDPETGSNKHSVITGLANFHKYKNTIPRSHHLGLVTLTGDFQDATSFKSGKGRALSEVSARTAVRNSEIWTEAEKPENSRFFQVPGDWHLRPHEWAAILARSRNSESLKIRPESEFVSDTISECRSTTTTAVHRQHERLQDQLRKATDFLPGKTPYNYPLSNSDVAVYADAYVKSFACGPFDKHQLLVNR